MQSLDPTVGNALLEDGSTTDILGHPKVAAAIHKLREDPKKFKELCDADPELKALFDRLNVLMSTKESELAVGSGAAPPQSPPPTAAPVARTFDEDDPPPPLQGEAEFDAEQARAEGTLAFTRADYDAACTHYERATRLEPTNHVHHSNLAAACLRADRPDAALAAAEESVAINPRYAKGYLRVGEALGRLGRYDDAVRALETGVQRAEGGVLKSLNAALKAARTQATYSAPSASPKAVVQQPPQHAVQPPSPPPPPPAARAPAATAAPAANAKIQCALDLEEYRHYRDLTKKGSARAGPPELRNELIFALD